MLRNLAEHKLPASFLIIQDAEDVCGHDMFIAFLKCCEHDTSIKQIHLICYENPPAFYLPNKQIKNEKLVLHDFFSDPCRWNDPSAPARDLSLFTSNVENLLEFAVFIDSLSMLAYHQGFFTMCRELSVLKKCAKNVLCSVHGDLFSPEQLEQLSFCTSACIELQSYSGEKNSRERMCKVTYKKPGGKIIKQNEFFSISDEFNINSRVPEAKTVVSTDTKKDIENLSTFKLGLHISEKEKKARDELVLPYLKTEKSGKVGEIFYQPEADDFEDDPDDDLDI